MLAIRSTHISSSTTSLNVLVKQHQLFSMKEDEYIEKMIFKFQNFVFRLKVLQEEKDLSTVPSEELMSSLRFNEIELNDEIKKKSKSIVLQLKGQKIYSKAIQEKKKLDGSEYGHQSDDELSLISIRVQDICKERNSFPRRNSNIPKINRQKRELKEEENHLL